MITKDMIPQLVGGHAIDRDGKKIGKIGQVFVDDKDGAPMWATVNTGFFGMTESFVPLASAQVVDRELTLTVSKDEVKESPHVADSGDHITAEEQGRLNRHYGQATGVAGQPAAGTGEGAREGRGGTTAEDRPGGDGHGGADAQGMTRSEERLRVGTESTETGSVRVRKYVVTEDQQVTVPVRHEEVRVERTPIREGERTTGATIGEDTQEVTLHAERPVVDTEVEQVERVRLSTDTVTEDQTVSGTVRKERIDVDDPESQVREGRDTER